MRDLVPSGGQSRSGWGFALGRFGFGGGGLHGGFGWGWVVGDFADHFVFVEVEADAAGIFYGDVESAEHELGSAEVDSVASEGVDASMREAWMASSFSMRAKRKGAMA